MKILLAILISVILAAPDAVGQANVKGGYIYYTFTGYNPVEKTSTYFVEVVIFSRRKTGAYLSVFNFTTGERISASYLGNRDPLDTSIFNNFVPCNPLPSFRNVQGANYHSMYLTLPDVSTGHLVAATFGNRDTGCASILVPSGTGVLATTVIPGVMNGINYYRNSSPAFIFRDSITVCRNTPFSFSSAATDANGDSLSYSLGDALQSSNDTTSPPNFPVQYSPPYSGLDPLGTSATIDPVTGIFSGMSSADAGEYNISIYVQEWRNGVLINTTKKESQIKVVACPYKKPLLKPVYSSCRVNTFTFGVETVCPEIDSFFWDFGDPNVTSDTSRQAMPTYTYPGNGTYTLKLQISNRRGFIDSAMALVKILDSITVQLAPDTAVCQTDLITLNPISDAVNYVWQESGGGTTLNNYFIKNPKALPIASPTTYFVTGTLNNCRDSGQTTLYSSLYPKVNAGRDTAICIGKNVQLNGTVTAAYHNWNPTSTLQNSGTLKPLATPLITTAYVLSVRDTFYCKKTVADTITVRVVQTFTVNAGNDTSAVIGQPLQIDGSSPGNTTVLQYTWQPHTYLNNNMVQNPVAIFNSNAPDIVTYKVTGTTREGCTASDEIKITVYKTCPDILVPTGFTPNGDGKNDVLKPILIGMRKLDRFSIYNRFGQLIFTTTNGYNGWDGKVGGNPQTAGAYIFIAEGKAYNGKQISKRGTTILIR